MSVREVVDLVRVEDGLDPVIAGWDAEETRQRVAVGAGVEDAGVNGTQPVDIDPEELLGVVAIGDFEARLAAAIGRDDEQEPAVVRLRPGASRERDDDLESAAVGGGRGRGLRLRDGEGRSREGRGGGDGVLESSVHRPPS